MRVLDATHRQNFLDAVAHFDACGWTPTHQMAKHADEYLRNSRLDKDSPWASVPGKQGEPYLGCRKNYHILLTDGGWNRDTANTNPANFDGAAHTLPDGTRYQPIYPYRDHEGGTEYSKDTANYPSTIADWAFKSWADPLKPVLPLAGGVEGHPTPSADYLLAPASETFTNRISKNTASLERYWNPRYNPATWPHMVTYTIGFSEDALPKLAHRSTGESAVFHTPTDSLPYGHDGSFVEYANGTYIWKAIGADKGHDMWHAAINGRGQFHAVKKAEDLKVAFRKIIEHIGVSEANARSGIGASGSSREGAGVGIFESYFDAKEAWKGWVEGKLLQEDGTFKGIAGWGSKNTAQILDADYSGKSDQRTVISSDSTGSKGVPFLMGSLGEAQWKLLGADAASAKDVINYLRGERSLEGKGLRVRKSIQGDVVNSNIWYVLRAVSNYAFADYATKYLEFAAKVQNRTAMIYVGGNDGMLHGFEADTGKERLVYGWSEKPAAESGRCGFGWRARRKPQPWRRHGEDLQRSRPPKSADARGAGGFSDHPYVPRGVMPHLAALTRPDHEHRYFVDGHSMTGDIHDGSGWKTVLVGALGAGGKGYYVLDVTRPEDFSQANADKIVLLDRSGDEASGAHIGHIFAAPSMDATNALRTVQIARLNNGRWAAIMGNGLNSTSRKSVLLIQYLDKERELDGRCLTRMAMAFTTRPGKGAGAPWLRQHSRHGGSAGHPGAGRDRAPHRRQRPAAHRDRNPAQHSGAAELAAAAVNLTPWQSRAVT